MPIPDPNKIWPKLEKDGVEEVRKKLAMGVYADFKIPVIKEWLRKKDEELNAPTYMYHKVYAPAGKVYPASEVKKLEKDGWVDTPAKFDIEGQGLIQNKLNALMKFISRMWKDPVWSKVIAGGILALFGVTWALMNSSGNGIIDQTQNDTSEKIKIEQNPSRHVTRDPSTHQTPIYARTKARVDQRVDYLISNKIDPWLMLPSGKMSPITLHDGRTVHYDGLTTYEGSPAIVFWGSLIDSFLKDEIRDILDEVGKECIANSIDAGVPLDETAMLLREMVQRVYGRMVYVDQRLRTKPHNQEKALGRDVKNEVEKMIKYVDDHAAATKALYTKSTN
mgnify:CR=1 FL=1